MTLPPNALCGRRSKTASGRTRLRGFFWAVCNHPWLVPLAVMASWLLCLPALDSGFMTDDFIHRRLLSGPATLAERAARCLTLFHFASPESNALLLADGSLPWWSDPQLNVAFFRPLSALTHVVDYTLFPDSPVLMHMHSLLWSAAALGAVWLLYREAFQRGAVAALGLLLYALEPTRAGTVTWLASRNALIAICLSALSIAAYLRGRRGRPWARFLSPVLLLFSLLAGEGGVAGLAYLVAAALFLEPCSTRRALAGVAPHAFCALAVLFLGQWQSHGVTGSSAYLDPRNDLGMFLAAMPQRAVTMLAAGLGGPSADAVHTYDLALRGLSTVVRWSSGLWIALCIAILSPLVMRSPSARFFAAGAALSLLPATAAAPSDRLLGWVSIGLVALFAECLESALLASPARRLGERIAVPLIALLRLGVAPLYLHAQVSNVGRAAQLLKLADQAIPNTADTRSKIAVFVNVPDDPMVSYLSAIRTATGTPKPKAVLHLSAGFVPMAVNRTGPRTLEVVRANGFLDQPTEQLTREVTRRPFEPGQRRVLPGMTVEIQQTLPDGRPERVAFVFDEDLESDRYLLRAFGEGNRYAPFVPPPVGVCVELPAPDFLALSLGHDATKLRQWLPDRGVGKHHLCNVWRQP